MKHNSEISDYRYMDPGHSCAHAYLMPALQAEVARVRSSLGSAPARLFDLGCGNGSVAAFFSNERREVTGVDPSRDGISAANAAYPHLRLSWAPLMTIWFAFTAAFRW